jgi:hypothetical protein
MPRYPILSRSSYVANVARAPVPNATVVSFPQSRTVLNSGNVFNSDYLSNVPLTSNQNSTVEPRAIGIYSEPKHKEIEPPSFSGKERWITFVNTFEDIARFNKWASETITLRFRICMKDEARFYLDTLHPDQSEDYFSLKGAFEQRYGDKTSISAYKNQFRRRRKNPGEKIDAFAFELRRLAGLGYPGQQGTLLDEIICNQFIEGIGNYDFKNYLRLEMEKINPVTLEALLKLAQSYESVMNPFQPNRAQARSQDYYSQDHKLDLQSDNQFRSQDKNRYPERDIRRIVCYHCQKEGHVATRCPENSNRLS